MSSKRPWSADEAPYDRNDACGDIPKTARRQKVTTSQRTPRQKASVSELAIEQLAKKDTAIEPHILERIKKCLDRANHPNTTESEAKAALHLSTRLMRLYNITTADLMENDQTDDRSHYGGSSVVSILSTKGEDCPVIQQIFVSTVAKAMEVFFDCKSFSTRRRSSVDWTFYGIAGNTVAAAVAFEMAHNRILDWDCHRRNRSASFSYCSGVADGLLSMAHMEKKKETEAAQQVGMEKMKDMQQEEELQQSKQVARWSPISPDFGSFFNCSDFESPSFESPGFEVPDFGPNSDDFSDQDISSLFCGMPPEGDKFWDLAADADIEACRPRVKAASPHDTQKLALESSNSVGQDQPIERSLGASWASAMQLVRFRESAEMVAKNYLKSKNIRLTSRTSKRPSNRDCKEYSRGWEDSKKIDIHQNRLEGA